jgi:ureidoglycolate lyase
VRHVTVVQLAVQPLTEADFAPFGQLIVAQPRDPDFTGDRSVGWAFEFGLDGTLEIMLMRTEYGPLRFSRLERHLNVTQSFIPLTGVAAAVVVGPRTDETNQSDCPRVDQLRAFLVDGSAGYMLYRGVWHSLDRYPLFAGHTDVAILTAKETTSELRNRPRADWVLTHDVDYRQLHGVEFDIGL